VKADRWTELAVAAAIFVASSGVANAGATIQSLPVDLEVPFAPTAVDAEGQRHLLYELHITNAARDGPFVGVADSEARRYATVLPEPKRVNRGVRSSRNSGQVVAQSGACLGVSLSAAYEGVGPRGAHPGARAGEGDTSGEWGRKPARGGCRLAASLQKRHEPCLHLTPCGQIRS
jgi:hypothetical protein